ncbi:WD40-repeat-containing domain protein [Circinella umbellata]|nr:WD40-repeat-containing domain protein [Circinella umbellata]
MGYEIIIPVSVSETTTSPNFKDSVSVYDYVQKRRTGYYFRRNKYSKYRQKILQAVQARCVATLSENPIDIKGHDKIFTSTWINSKNVVVGTKENKLLVLDITNNVHQWTSIPLIKNNDSTSSTSSWQQRVSKSMDVRTRSCANDNGQNNKGSQSGSNNNYSNNVEESDNHHGDEENNIFLREPITPTSIRQRFGQPMREGRRVSPPINSTAIGSGEQHLIHQYQQQLKKCDGIRSLSVNPSKTLLAVGLADPPVVMVYRLSDFTPMGITVRDHRDAVFSVQWLDDSTFVTGSRDGSLGLWKCNNNDYVNITKDGLEKVPRLWSSNNDEYASRIRDTKLIGSTTVASLAANGIVQIWDLDQRQKQKNIKLWHTQELVCMAPQQQGRELSDRKGLLAVGSQEHVTLLDPRLSSASSAAQEFPSQDQDWGVRSLAFQNYIVTCGGGLGRVSFYDIRNKAFIPSHTTTSSTSFCSVSSGWLDESSSIYQTYFNGQHRLMPQAVYTLEYSPDDSRKLFTAGGPIQSSLRGCYAALWC